MKTISAFWFLMHAAEHVSGNCQGRIENCSKCSAIGILMTLADLVKSSTVEIARE